jgi:hypothetical protein
MTQTSQLTIEHVVIQSTRSYEEVKAALEECLRVMANTDGRKRKQVEEDRQAEEQASLQLKDAEALVIIDVSHRYRQLIEARKELEAATALQSAARKWEALCYAQIGGLGDRGHSLYCPGASFHLRARHENHPVGGVCRNGNWAFGGDGCPSGRDEVFYNRVTNLRGTLRYAVRRSFRSLSDNPAAFYSQEIL